MKAAEREVVGSEAVLGRRRKGCGKKTEVGRARGASYYGSGGGGGARCGGGGGTIRLGGRRGLGTTCGARLGGALGGWDYVRGDMEGRAIGEGRASRDEVLRGGMLWKRRRGGVGYCGGVLGRGGTSKGGLAEGGELVKIRV